MIPGRLARGACWSSLLLAAAACQRSETTTAVVVDAAAVKEYQALLEKQLAVTEEVVAALKTVASDSVSRENAKKRLAELAVQSDRAKAELNNYTFKDKDLRARLAIQNEAAARLAERQERVGKMYLAEIHRINTKVAGGEEFFQKDLREMLEGMKR